MYFAEFYTKSAISDDLIPACSDRSVLKLDGRESRDSQFRVALKWGRQHGYEAFRICKGESFTRSSPLSAMMRTASH